MFSKGFPMGIKVQYCSFEEYSAVSDGAQSRRNIEYIRDRLSDKVKEYGDYGRRAYDRLRERFEEIDYDALERRAKSISRKFNNNFGHDVVRALRTLEEFQHAKPTMRRYIMASENIRRHYKGGRCDGYGDEYYDPMPSCNKHEHIDYRRMNDCMPVESENGVVWNQYFDQRGYLDPIEKDDIKESISIAEFFFKVGNDDPTSKRNRVL